MKVGEMISILERFSKDREVVCSIEEHYSGSDYCDTEDVLMEFNISNYIENILHSDSTTIEPFNLVKRRVS